MGPAEWLIVGPVILAALFPVLALALAALADHHVRWKSGRDPRSGESAEVIALAL